MDNSKLPAEILPRIPIFAGMTEAECRQVVDGAPLVEFAPGEVIVQQGRQSRRLWILLEGVCRVVLEPGDGHPNTQPIDLATLEPYSNFGEMSFFHSAPHSASVHATTAVKLLGLERDHFNTLLANPTPAMQKLLLNTLRSIAERLRRMDDWVADLMMKKSATGGRVPEWDQLRETLFTGWKL